MTKMILQLSGIAKNILALYGHVSALRLRSSREST